MGKLIVLLGESSELLHEAMKLEEFNYKDELNYYYKVWWPELSLEADNLPLSQSSTLLYVDDVICKHSVGTVICTHSELVFTAIRVAIHEERLNHEDVEFRYYEFDDGSYESLRPDTDGRLTHWPAKMFREQDNLLCKLLAPKRAKTLSPLNDETISFCLETCPNSKIDAIKLFRYKTGCLLKDAKDHIEAALKIKDDSNCVKDM